MSTAERGASKAGAMGVAVQLAAAEQAKSAAELTYEQRRAVHRMLVTQNRVALGLLSAREREMVDVVAGLLGGVARELAGGAVVVETAIGARVLTESERRRDDAREAYERACNALLAAQRAAQGTLTQQITDLTVVRVARAEARGEAAHDVDPALLLARAALDGTGRALTFPISGDESGETAIGIAVEAPAA